VKILALAVLALAVIAIIIMPASAQSGVPVKNALVVVVSEQDDAILQSMIAAGGSPSGILNALETAEGLLLSTSAPHVSTDSVGRFALDATLGPGAYNLAVFAPGFVASSESLAIDGEGATRNMTIFMQQSAMLSGRVTNEQGEPLSGIVVAASSPHSVNYDITMDDGVFVLDTGLKTGPHEIYAFKPGIDFDLLQGLLNKPGLGMLDNNKASTTIFKSDDNNGYVSHVATVQLEQGKLTTLNVQLKGSHVISGRVMDSAGNAVPNVVVFAFDDRGAMANAAAVTDSDGRYVLGNDLAPGRYTIVIPSLFSESHAPTSVAVTVPAEHAIDFVLNESSAINGRVVDSRGNPVAGASVLAISKNLDLNNTRLAQFLSAGVSATRTDPEGRFTIDSGIGSGTYVITASFGTVPVSGSVEALAGGSAEIILNFGEKITVKGKVTNDAGRPLENASVAPSFASTVAGVELFAARTGPDGTYELVVPLKDNSTRSLFEKVAVSAEGYRSATTQGNSTVMLEKMPTAKITGVVIAQKSLSPPVETVLTRKGTIVFEHEGTPYDVGQQTNARVLAATFDPSSRSVRINLEDVQDAAVRSEFLIPKEFMAGPFVVSLDRAVGENIITTENQTHFIIAVEHEHDLREIMIQGATAVPEFPLPAVLAAAGMAATLAWKRLRR